MVHEFHIRQSKYYTYCLLTIKRIKGVIFVFSRRKKKELAVKTLELARMLYTIQTTIQQHNEDMEDFDEVFEEVRGQNWVLCLKRGRERDRDMHKLLLLGFLISNI